MFHYLSKEFIILPLVLLQKAGGMTKAEMMTLCLNSMPVQLFDCSFIHLFLYSSSRSQPDRSKFPQIPGSRMLDTIWIQDDPG